MLLLVLLFVGAGYVLATYPLDFGNRLWSNPTRWVDNPKAVAPTWSNLWRSEPLPQHLILDTTEPTEIKEARAGRIENYVIPFTYNYTTPPTFLAVTLQQITYVERPPLIALSLIRPDGNEVRLLRHGVRGPREDEKGPYLRYFDDPVRIQLSTDNRPLSMCRNFWVKPLGCASVTRRDRRPRCSRSVFGTPSADGNGFHAAPR